MKPTGTAETTGKGKQLGRRKSIRNEVKEETDALAGKENTSGRGQMQEVKVIQTSLRGQSTSTNKLQNR